MRAAATRCGHGLDVGAVPSVPAHHRSGASFRPHTRACRECQAGCERGFGQRRSGCPFHRNRVARSSGLRVASATYRRPQPRHRRPDAVEDMAAARAADRSCPPHSIPRQRTHRFARNGWRDCRVRRGESEQDRGIRRRRIRFSGELLGDAHRAVARLRFRRRSAAGRSIRRPVSFLARSLSDETSGEPHPQELRCALECLGQIPRFFDGRIGRD